MTEPKCLSDPDSQLDLRARTKTFRLSQIDWQNIFGIKNSGFLEYQSVIHSVPFTGILRRKSSPTLSGPDTRTTRKSSCTNYRFTCQPTSPTSSSGTTAEHCGAGELPFVLRAYPPLDFKKTPLVQSLVERTAFSDQN